MLKVKAIKDFLWFKVNEEIVECTDLTRESMEKWVTDQLVEIVDDIEETEEKPKEDKVAKRVADFKADLADDGKRNYSHDPKRKKPGRKKGRWL